MPLELSELVAERSVKPRRKRRGRGKGLVAGGVVAAVVLAGAAWLLLGGGGSRGGQGRDGRAPADASADPADPRDAEGAADPATLSEAGPEPAGDAPTYRLPDDEKALLTAYPGKPRLDGLEMLASGHVDEAEEWIGNYLAAPSDGRDDQATLALAVVYLAKGESRAAENTLANLVRQRPDSNRSGDGYYLLGKIRAADGRLDEAEDAFLEAVRVYEKSHGGRRAAKRLADELYERHVTDYPKRTEWERVRDLYSIAMRGLVSPESPGRRPGEVPADWSRGDIVSRMDQLNEWVIFTPHARPKEGYPTNISFHEVSRGDTLGGIAKRYGVTVGTVRRLNGIPPDSHIIRPGQELKILRGRTEICVDTRKLVMTVWIDRRFLRQYPVGIGREGRTPVGTFRIASRQIDPDWRDIPFGDPRNILGTRWLGFERVGAGRGIGIHGSRQVQANERQGRQARQERQAQQQIEAPRTATTPVVLGGLGDLGEWEGVGERVSEGCIRMRNPDVEELFDFVPLGTEVVIYE